MGQGELNHSTLFACRLSIECISNILGMDLCKLKLKEIVVGNLEVTKRQYLQPTTTCSATTAAISAATATFATKKATTTSSTANTITIGTSTTDAKAKGIKAKISDNFETVLNKIRTHYGHTGCQEHCLMNGL